MVNRSDPDFTDDELRLCVQLQPALVALYLRLTLPADSAGSPALALTRREQAVLGYLADGLTAEAIARRCWPGQRRCASTCRIFMPSWGRRTVSGRSCAGLTSAC